MGKQANKPPKPTAQTHPARNPHHPRSNPLVTTSGHQPAAQIPKSSTQRALLRIDTSVPSRGDTIDWEAPSIIFCIFSSRAPLPSNHACARPSLQHGPCGFASRRSPCGEATAAWCAGLDGKLGVVEGACLEVIRQRFGKVPRRQGRDWEGAWHMDQVCMYGGFPVLLHLTPSLIRCCLVFFLSISLHPRHSPYELSSFLRPSSLAHKKTERHKPLWPSTSRNPHVEEGRQGT